MFGLLAALPLFHLHYLTVSTIKRGLIPGLLEATEELGGGGFGAFKRGSKSSGGVAIGGRFLAELTKEVLSDLEASKYQDQFHYMAISDDRQRIMPMPQD